MNAESVDIGKNIAEQVEVSSPTPTATKPLTIKKVQLVVAKFYDILHADMVSKKRKARFVRPRQVAMYLSKVLGDPSYAEIGRRFDGMDHSSVMYAVRKIACMVGDKSFPEPEEVLPIDQDLVEKIAELKSQLH